MSKYIDAEKLISEIKRRLREIPKKETDKRLRAVYGGVEFELMGILEFIDSLPEDNPSEDLEKEIDNMIEDLEGCAISENGELKAHLVSIEQLRDFARHFAQWQKEQPEVDLENNGWIDCRKQMPKETKQWSDTLQGHREWTESDLVLAWDSMYGCRVDATKNGKWMSEQRVGYAGQVIHGIIAWRPIPEFNEELLFNARKEK